MELILTLLLFVILLFALSRGFRAWVFGLILQRFQRKIAEQMQRQAEEYARAEREGRRAEGERPAGERREGSGRRAGSGQKVPMQEIEAQRFKKRSDSEYTDFEEI